jgi:putative PIN family toxin of toxin-antitoxin system
MRVVLDTNVLVSGLAFPGGPPGRLVAAWRGGVFSRVCSDFGLQELARVLPRLSARTGLTPRELLDFLDAFRASVEWVVLDAAVLARAAASGLRDPDDVPVLATLVAAQADCLITGDKDLLALAGRFPILSPAGFCARYAP